ncbi:MAG: SDR family NAD(P)-dependent oxidoreductase [Hahellaceae bacterium]|nr:SDR family NAD(P)-dependent oxidoreductase [Hahellaceae bacterium]
MEVYGTAGSTLKRQFLRDLGLHHVSDSRSVRFAEEILAYSMNEGVDIILNSLAGEAIVRSLELLRVHGRFLELGKRDIYGGSAISLHPFRQSLSYFAIDMARAMSPEQSGPLLQEIRLLLEQEVVKPLPYRIFQFADASEAFREMAQGRHVGKIVLTVDQTSLVSREAVSNARFPMCGDATYLITGGLRGLGLSLAEYMANRGVKYLALTSSSGPVSEEAQEGLNRLRAKGVTVLARKSDVANLNEMEEFSRRSIVLYPPCAA